VHTFVANKEPPFYARCKQGAYMPQLRKRIYFTPSPQIYEILENKAATQKQSLSRTLEKMVEDSLDNEEEIWLARIVDNIESDFNEEVLLTSEDVWKNLDTK
jgi:hypothetical protein